MYCFRFVAIIAISLAATSVSAQTKQEPTETLLTFLSHRSGHNLLYKSQPDGNNPQPIFGGPILDVPSVNSSYAMFREPHWTRQSPNGKHFASWTYEMGKPHSEYQGVVRAMLWVGDIAGNWTRIVNPDCREEFAWAPDSKRIAFSISSTKNYRGSLQKSPETTEIYVSGIDGSDFNCILEQYGKWMVLDWSPDAARILIIQRHFGQQPGDGTSALFEFRVADAMDAREREPFDPEWAASGALKFLDPIVLELEGLQFNTARYSPTRNEIAIETYDPKNMYAPISSLTKTIKSDGRE